MHTHVGSLLSEDSATKALGVERDLFLYLANGVTTVRNVDYGHGGFIDVTRSAEEFVLRARARAAAGELWSPWIYTSGGWQKRWTLRRIAALIAREFGVRYHPRYLERPLKALGFTAHRPATQARERDEYVIARWPTREWVALKKGPPGAPTAGIPVGGRRAAGGSRRHSGWRRCRRASRLIVLRWRPSSRAIAAAV